MRIAVFHSEFTEVGGAEVQALNQAHYLHGRGDQIDLVSFQLDPERWSDAIGGLGLVLLEGSSWREKLGLWSPMFSNRLRARRIGRSLRKLLPNVVLAHNPPSNTILGMSGLNALKVWYCHEPPRDIYPEETTRELYSASRSGDIKHLSPALGDLLGIHEASSAWRLKERELDQEGIRGLNRLIANSEYTRSSIEAVYGIRGIEVVNPMVNFKDSLRHRFGLDRSGLKILVQTRMEAIKNVDTVLRAFARVRSRLGGNPSLHLVGTGSQLPYLMSLAGELNLLENVRFHGFLGKRDLESVRGSCDVFALLPWDEPFGMVFPECADAGLLLIGSNHGGPLEILENGRYGWNCPAHSAESLGEVFEKVWALTDSEVDHRRSETLRSCRGRYSTNVIGARLRNLLSNE